MFLLGSVVPSVLFYELPLFVMVQCIFGGWNYWVQKYDKNLIWGNFFLLICFEGAILRQGEQVEILIFRIIFRKISIFAFLQN